MLFQSKQIKGQGRGHQIGFPTINLVIPDDILLNDGIYAVWAAIEGKTYKGALHFGAVPTFGFKNKTMELHLIDVTDDTVPDTGEVLIEVDVVEYLREVKKFDDAESLAIQIHYDIENVKKLLG